MNRKKELCLVLAALCAMLALGWAQFTQEAVPAISWGLSFQTEGQTPLSPTDRKTLSRYDAAFVGNTGEKVLYLTFDAGYENGCTAQILDVLQKHQVSAAFFLVGNYMEKNADLVRRMVQEGHIVGNHTMHHKDMSKLTGEAFRDELTQLERLYRDITGKALPKFYRPPQGNYTLDNLEEAKNCGYKTVFWSLAYADWDNEHQPTAEQAFSKLLPRTHNGAVILLHSTSKTNAAILDQLLTEWKDMGYRFASLEELF